MYYNSSTQSIAVPMSIPDTDIDFQHLNMNMNMYESGNHERMYYRFDPEETHHLTIKMT